MQFFPADIFGKTGDLAATAFKSAANSVNVASGAAGETGLSFQDIFASLGYGNEHNTMQDVFASPGSGNKHNIVQDVFSSLSAYNEHNTIGVPLTTRSTRDDRSLFKSDEFAHLKGKLAELGVSEKVLDEYFGYMSAAYDSPGIAQMRSSISEITRGRLGADLDKQEFLQLSVTLGKLGFSNEEIGEFEQMMWQGDSLGMLKKIRGKVETLAGNGTKAEITKEELVLLIKACDPPVDYSAQITSALENFVQDGNTRIALDKQTFNSLFGGAVASLEIREAELVKLSENIDTAIESMLAYRNSKSNEPVSDMRGSALTERTETMARILAAMVNGESEEGEENSSSHLMDGENSGKARDKEDIVASLADNKRTPKAVQAERETEITAAIRGKTHPRDTQPEAAAPAEAQTERATTENILRKNPFTDDHKTGQERQGRNDSAASSADRAALSAKVQESPGVVFGLFGQTENSSASAHNAETARNETHNARIFEQIERGIVKNASDGSRQIVLRLDPPELGKLTLSLTVAQGEVKAFIRTESTATTQAVGEQLAQIKQSLEEQGFKVSSLEVETRAQDHAGTDRWSGADQHNQERELLDQSRFMRLARTRAKEGETLAQSMQHVEQPASLSAAGLHIIA